MLKVSNIAVSLDEKDYAKVIANTLNIRKTKIMAIMMQIRHIILLVQTAEIQSNKL